MISNSRNLPDESHLRTFGERLRWAIKNTEGIRTQAELARRMNVKAPMISQLVKRDDPPGKELLPKISAALRVSEAWLAYGVPEPRNGRDDKPGEGRMDGEEGELGPLASWPEHYKRILDVLERESRAAENRSEAARELAVAARISEETARARQAWLLSPDRDTQAVAQQGEEAVFGPEPDETGEGTQPGTS